jgi:hypothetical protein
MKYYSIEILEVKSKTHQHTHHICSIFSNIHIHVDVSSYLVLHQKPSSALYNCPLCSLTVRLLCFSALYSGYASPAEGKSGSNCWANSCQQNLFPLPCTTKRDSSTNFTAPTTWANEITNQTCEAVHDRSGRIRKGVTNKGNNHRLFSMPAYFMSLFLYY